MWFVDDYTMMQQVDPKAFGRLIQMDREQMFLEERMIEEEIRAGMR